eukprot:scaffold4403_cov133-Amphora_coffeaeformis.AAC.1
MSIHKAKNMRRNDLGVSTSVGCAVQQSTLACFMRWKPTPKRSAKTIIRDVGRHHKDGHAGSCEVSFRSRRALSVLVELF